MKLKPFLLLFLAAALLQLPFTVIAEEPETVQDDSLTLSAAYLQGIGIDTAFCEKGEVGRGEFISLLLKVMHMDAARADIPEVFSDVDQGTEYAAEIITAYTLGMAGGSGGQFFPDRAVTYAEALKMAVVALNDKLAAEQYGGYPTGYMMAAGNAGITKNISVSAADVLSGRNAAVLLAQTLTADVMITVGVGENITYESYRGRTLLTENHHLTKVEGIITANEASALSAAGKKAGEGRIAIDGVSYEYDGAKDALLGYHVLGFVSNNDDSLSFLIPYKNEEVEIPAQDMLRYADGKVYQAVGEKETRYPLDKSFYFLYNGKAASDYTADDFLPESGSVRLLDNNRDGDYDAVFVTDVRYMEVTAVDQLKKVVYGKSEAFASLDLGAEQGEFTYRLWDGKKLQQADFYGLSAGALVAAAVSKDQLLGELTVCTKSVSGTITGLADEKYIQIDGVEYEVTKHFTNYYPCSLNLSGKFTLGLDGRVVAFKKNEGAGYAYGYLIDAKYSGAVQARLEAKILTEQGEVAVLAFAQSVTVDGSKKNSGNSSENSVKNVIFNGEQAIRQLVRYSLDEEGKINGLDTAKQAEGLQDQYTATDSLTCYHKGISKNFKSGQNTFTSFRISGGTPIFFVPVVTAPEVEDEDFVVGTASNLQNDGKYTVDSFDLREDGLMSVVVCYDTVRAATQNSPVGIVEKVEEVWTDMENTGDKRIHLWSNGSYQAYYIDDKVSTLVGKDPKKKLAPGDIVRFGVTNDRITTLEVDYDESEKSFTASGKDYVADDNAYNRILNYRMYSPYKTYGGNVYASGIKVNGVYDYSLANLRLLDIGGAKCVLFNRGTQQLRPLGVNEILDYVSARENASEMMVVQNYWQVKTLIVYQEAEEEKKNG